MSEDQDLSPEEAQWLLEALAETDFMSVECDGCGRTIAEHSHAEVQECLERMKCMHAGDSNIRQLPNGYWAAYCVETKQSGVSFHDKEANNERL